MVNETFVLSRGGSKDLPRLSNKVWYNKLPNTCVKESQFISAEDLDEERIGKVLITSAGSVIWRNINKYPNIDNERTLLIIDENHKINEGMTSCKKLYVSATKLQRHNENVAIVDMFHHEPELDKLDIRITACSGSVSNTMINKLLKKYETFISLRTCRD